MEPHGANKRMVDMLETMREEQEALNRELAAKEEEKARFVFHVNLLEFLHYNSRWGERTAQLLGKKEDLEATFVALRRQDMFLTEEVNHLEQQLDTFNTKLNAGVAAVEAYARIMEKLEMTRAVLETRKGVIEEKLKKHREGIVEAEGETKLGKLLELARKTRAKVEEDVEAKVVKYGSVEEIKETIEEKRRQVQRQDEEHWHVEEENQLQLQVFYFS